MLAEFWMRTVTRLESETPPGRVMSRYDVPVTFVATWVSAPAPVFTKMFTPVTAAVAFQATLTTPPFAKREARPGFSRTRSPVVIPKAGLLPATPSEAPLEFAHTTCTE